MTIPMKCLIGAYAGQVVEYPEQVAETLLGLGQVESLSEEELVAYLAERESAAAVAAETTAEPEPVPEPVLAPSLADTLADVPAPRVEIAELGAADARAMAMRAETSDELDALEAGERLNPRYDGGRSSVLKAIATRREEL